MQPSAVIHDHSNVNEALFTRQPSTLCLRFVSQPEKEDIPIYPSKLSGLGPKMRHQWCNFFSTRHIMDMMKLLTMQLHIARFWFVKSGDPGHQCPSQETTSMILLDLWIKWLSIYHLWYNNPWCRPNLSPRMLGSIIELSYSDVAEFCDWNSRDNITMLLPRIDLAIVKSAKEVSVEKLNKLVHNLNGVSIGRSKNERTSEKEGWHETVLATATFLKSDCIVLSIGLINLSQRQRQRQRQNYNSTPKND